MFAEKFSCIVAPICSLYTKEEGITMTNVVAMTVEQFKEALPPRVKSSVNQALIDQINSVIGDPEMYESYRDNLVGYTSVMKDGKFKIENYIEAVKYVSHKLLGASNGEAYSRTFPNKVALFKANGVSDKDISSYVSAYNKGKLVNLIYAQTMVPFYVLNQDMYQRALNTQAELMIGAKSEKVRSDAANSLLTHLRPPETIKVELDIGHKEDSAISLLRANTMELARLQRLQIESGMSTALDMAHVKLDVIDVVAKEVL